MIIEKKYYSLGVLNCKIKVAVLGVWDEITHVTVSVSASVKVMVLIFVPTAIVCWTLSVTGRFVITGAVFCCTFTINVAVDEPVASLHVIVIVYVFCVSKSNP